MPLELVKTGAGDILMGAAQGNQANPATSAILATFKSRYPSLAKKVASPKLFLTMKSPKGQRAALVERGTPDPKDVLTQTYARLQKSGKIISAAVSSGRAPEKVAGSAAVWLSVAGNLTTLIASYPALLVAASKAAMEEAKIAARAAGV